MSGKHDEMMIVAPGKQSRWIVWSAYGACGWAFLFAALALVQSWGRIVPRWILLILSWGAGTLLAVHGALFFTVGLLALSGVISASTPETVLRWYTFLWGPWWLIGGILFLVAAWIYFRRSPDRRVSLVFSLLGVFGALVLLVLSGGTIG